MPAYKLITPPAAEPVSLATAKAWLRLEDGTEDTLVTGLLQAARELCETHTASKFVTQTWRMYLDAFPGYLDHRSPAAASLQPLSTGAWFWNSGRWGLALPFGPVQSVAAVTYNDATGTPHTMLAGTDYTADVVSIPARVLPIWSQFWPLTQYAPNAVSIDFVAGFGSPADVPQSICTAIMMLVSAWYGNRDAYATGSGEPKEMPFAVRSLLGQYRDLRY